MIFNKENLKESSKSRGFRRYKWKDKPLEIICHGRMGMGYRNKTIQYWVCKPSLMLAGKYAKEFMTFSFHPPWAEKKLYQALEQSMIKEGKYKLMRAIYNDFEA